VIHFAPQDEQALLSRCSQLEGLSFSQLAIITQSPIPLNPVQRKGWAGQAIERFLGATAGTQSLPDFHELGIELKTIPLNAHGRPSESTFIVTISLLTIHQEKWLTSYCYQKLKRILWVPIEGDVKIPFGQRRVGRAFLWSASEEIEQILQDDWCYLTTLISTGHLSDIDASHGEYLQIRPKAANARSLCYAYDEQGNQSLTLPRGFYLRAAFTQYLIK